MEDSGESSPSNAVVVGLPHTANSCDVGLYQVMLSQI